MKSKKFVWIAAAILLAGMISSCNELGIDEIEDIPKPGPQPGGKGTTEVTFTGVSAAGEAVGEPSAEEGYTTTALTLHFSKAIAGLTAKHITLAPKGDGNSITRRELVGRGPSYTLYVSDVEVNDDVKMEVEVSVTNPTGYTIKGVPREVEVYAGNKDPKVVVFSGLTANNDQETGVTESLTLTFRSEIEDFKLGDIRLEPDNIYLNLGSTEAEKGELSAQSDTSCTLEVSEIKKGGSVSVTVTKEGYAFKPTTQSVTVSSRDNNDSGETPDLEPPTLTKPDVIGGAADEPSIKAKFGISSEGTDAVTATFNTLSAFIKTGGLEKGEIHLGDWIDLEDGLTVGDYNSAGVFTITAKDDNSRESTKHLLRLIVVGINSFNGLNDNDTPHVVFQFQNIPVKRRMNAEKTSVGGYRDSEMREYLVPFQSKEGSGKFLAGLINAGVPEDVLWVPLRCVYTGSSTEKISDPLWLPTGKEMFCDGFQYDEEEADNQAWLEYYESGDLVKYQNSSAAGVYWVATPYGKNKFFSVSRSGGEVDNPADSAYGVVPAFCVR